MTLFIFTLYPEHYLNWTITMARRIVVYKLFIPGMLLILSLFSCSPRRFFQRRTLQTAPEVATDEFNRRCELAQQLAKDDRMAWKTSDTIAAEKPMLLDTLDQTWFVYPLNDKRFAFYGRFSPDDDRYYPKYVFTTDNKGSILRLPPEVNDTTLSYARAVNTGCTFFRSIIDSLQLDINYNHYIRLQPDASYKMWFFPAGYDNYYAHGLDIYLTIDSTGTIVTTYRVFGKFPRYFELDKKEQIIELDNTYDSLPSLGNLFFMYMNRKHFKKIIIVNTASTSTMVYTPERKKWQWVHTAKNYLP
jgi:hypothetical protein